HMLDSATRTCFEEALASGSLEALGNKLKTERLSQVAIYVLFESFWTFLGDSRRETEADLVYDHLDWVWGWCSPGARFSRIASRMRKWMLIEMQKKVPNDLR